MTFGQKIASIAWSIFVLALVLGIGRMIGSIQP